MTDLFAQLTPDNNRHGNQKALEENRLHFEGQGRIVLEHLLKGEKVSGLRMMQLHGIMDTRARIYSIKNLLIKVIGNADGLKKNKIQGANGAQEWSLELSPSDKSKLSELLMSKMRDAA